MRKNKLTVQTEWKKRIKKYRIRIVLCGGLILSAYLIPQLTQAQYKWTLNGYSTLQAKSYYFASDKLRDEKNDMIYPISGWDGEDLKFKLEIRNYENALLANAQGEDTEYDLKWQISTIRKNSQGGAYSLKLNSYQEADSNGNEIENGFHSTISGTGTPKKDEYTFEIVPSNDGYRLQEGDSVRITITAENKAQGNSYSKNLKATFVYRVSKMDAYVNKFDVSEDTQYGTIKLSLGTGTLPDLEAKQQTVTVWWDPSKLEVNTFNYVFMNTNAAGGYKTQEVKGRTFDTLQLTNLGSNAFRDLEFRKAGSSGETWFGENDESHIGKNTKLKDAIENQYIGFYIEGTNN